MKGEGRYHKVESSEDLGWKCNFEKISWDLYAMRTDFQMFDFNVVGAATMKATAM